MAIVGDALRQAFMPKHEYQSLREEDKAWLKLQRPLFLSITTFLSLVVLISTVLSLKIVFPGDYSKRPFCNDPRLQPLPVNMKGGGDSDLVPGAVYLTDQETVDFYWTVVFVPSMIVFMTSIVFLVAGITVAYSASRRHTCLKVVENNLFTSKRGGVRCLSVLNTVFAVIFGLFALFLGSTLLTLRGSCSLPLFWFYEIATWGLVILYTGTAFFLRRKAAMTVDDGDFSSRNAGLEMLEANSNEVTPDVERRVNEGFKAWMGSSLLSSDEEDEPDSFEEIPSQLTSTVSNRQRV